MTDSYHTLTVVLGEDIREDDAKALIAAIGQMRGVLNVTGAVADVESYMAQVRARQKIVEKLWEVMYKPDS